MQSMADGEYRYILNYQDHGMKDVYPVALKSKRVALPELFRELLNEANDLIDSRKGETLCDDPRDPESAGTHF